MRLPVGTVTQLIRYPVKSTAGEHVAQSTVTASGLAGDRRFAVADRGEPPVSERRSGGPGQDKVASAKHPAKWGRLLEVVSSYGTDPVGDQAAVHLLFPDGTEAVSGDGRVDQALSKLTGRDVQLITAPAPVTTIERLWTGLEGQGSAQPDTVTDTVLPDGSAAGTFFDFAPVHVVTTGTLRYLAGLARGSDFDVRRFRPNLLIEADDLAERSWVGHHLQIGDVVMRLHAATPRCIVTTVMQPGLPADRDVLRTVARHSQVPVLDRGPRPCVGVYAEVEHPGVVRRGDTATLG